MSNPFEAAIRELGMSEKGYDMRYRRDLRQGADSLYLKDSAESCRAAIAVLEAAGKVDKQAAQSLSIESNMDTIQELSGFDLNKADAAEAMAHETILNLYALIEALPGGDERNGQ